MSKRERLVLTIRADGKVAEQDLQKVDAAIKRVAAGADAAADQMVELQKAAAESAKAAEKAGQEQAKAAEKAVKATEEQVAAQKRVAAAAEAAEKERVAAEKAVQAAAAKAADAQLADIEQLEAAQKRLAEVKEATGKSRKKDDVAARAAAQAEVKAAQAVLRANQDSAKAALDGLKKEAAERKRMAADAIKAAKEESRVRTQAAKEAGRAEVAAVKATQRAAAQAAKGAQTVQGFALRADAQNDPDRALKSLGIQRADDINARIDAIQRARDVALRAERLTAEDRLRIEQATNAHIERERAKLAATNADHATEAMNALGLRRRGQIEAEIAAEREKQRIALSGANTSAADRLRIERQTNERIKALNKELANATASTFKQRMQQAAQSLRGLGESVRGAGMGMSLTTSAPVALGLRAAVNQTANYEQEMQNVRAVYQGMTDAEFKKLDAKAKELGAKTSFTTAEVAAGIKMLASNGVKVDDILGGALDASLSMAVAIDTDLSSSADMITDAMVQFGKKAEELPQLADLMTGARSSSKFTADDLKGLLGMGGGVAGMGGMSFEDFLAGTALAAPFATSGSDAGTGFKTMMLRLSSKDSEKARTQYGFNAFTVSKEVAAAQENGQRAVEAATKDLEEAKAELERLRRQPATKETRAQIASAQRRVTDAKGRLNTANANQVITIDGARTDSAGEDGQLRTLEEIADELRRIGAGKTDQEKAEMYGAIFGQDAIRTAMALAASGSEGVRTMRGNIEKGDAKEAERIRLDSFQGELKLFQSAVEAFNIAMVESGLLETLRGIVEKLTEWVTAMGELSPWVMKFIAYGGVLVAVLGPLLLVVGQMAIGAAMIAKAFTLLGGTGPSVMGMFKFLLKTMGGLVGWLLRGALAVAGFLGGLVSAPVLIGAAITAALVALGVAVWAYRDEIWAALTNAWDTASEYATAAFTALWDWIKSGFLKMVSFISDGLKNLYQDSWLQKGVRFVVGSDEEEPQKFAAGGINIRGPGTGTSDSIPARLSAGESVITARATRFWGPEFLSQIQNMNPRAIAAPSLAAIPVPVSAGSGGGRDLHPITLVLGNNGPISGVYGTPDAVRKMEKFQNRKAVLQPASISKAQR